VDSLYGWATGLSGTIIHTSNGGSDWIIQDSKTENNIYDIFFLNRNLGWAVYWEGSNYPFGTYILKTTDGGNNWMTLPNPKENIFSQCILFLDSLNGWMGGKPYPIVRTSDGGDTWTEAEIDSSDFSNFPVYDIQFYDSSFGYASGGFVDCCGIIWSTSDGGDSWNVIETQYVAPEPIYQLHINDSLNVIGVGGDFESLGYGVGMMRTSDGGGSWNFEYIGVSGVSWDIDFRTDKEAWATLAGEQKLIYSLDAGLTWTVVSTPDSSLIFKMMFPDSLHGFGVGTDGAIVKYKLSVSSVQDEDKYIPEKFILQQNFPNPFNPSSNIRYSIPQSSNVVLKVFDVIGKEIETLVDEEKPIGNYELIWNASSLPSGVYFYQLKAGSFIETKKMVLMK
jgi:photosystem II stability/assembly factor-like uncharacterized protein